MPSCIFDAIGTAPCLTIDAYAGNTEATYPPTLTDDAHVRVVCRIQSKLGDKNSPAPNAISPGSSSEHSAPEGEMSRAVDRVMGRRLVILGVADENRCASES